MSEVQVESFSKEEVELFKHCWLPALGLWISLFEFFITTIYQFYFLGFGLSVCMIVASSVYLFLKYRDYKIQVKSMQAPTDINSISTQILLQQHQENESNQKIGRWQKVLFVAYCILIAALVFMFGGRFCSLCARGEFRRNIKSYPDACSDWALNKGCTKIGLT